MNPETITIHDSVLVITSYGKLIRLWCPFTVRVITPIDALQEGKIYKVLSVRMGDIKL